MNKQLIFIFSVTGINEISGTVFNVSDWRQNKKDFDKKAFKAVYKFSYNIKFKLVGYWNKNNIFVKLN